MVAHPPPSPGHRTRIRLSESNTTIGWWEGKEGLPLTNQAPRVPKGHQQVPFLPRQLHEAEKLSLQPAWYGLWARPRGRTKETQPPPLPDPHAPSAQFTLQHTSAPYMCTYTHVHSHTHVHPPTPIHMNTHVCPPTHTCTHASTHTRAHAPTCMHMCTHTHVHSPTHVHPPTHTCAHTRAPTHMHTSTHPHPVYSPTLTHTNAHTRAPTHTYTLRENTSAR